MANTVPEMLKMSQAQLDDLFTKSPAGEIPQGRSQRHGDRRARHDLQENIASFINHFAWQGKVFDPQKGVLRNDPAFWPERDHRQGLQGRSWMDGKECIVLDYSETSFSRIGFAMKSAKSLPAPILEKFIGAKSA